MREHRQGREPWQRDDETVARLAELDPAPHGVLVDGGAAVVRSNAGRVNLLQLAGDARAVLDGGARRRRAGLDPQPGDRTIRRAAAFRELGGDVVVRQHEMLLELDAA